MSDLTTVQWDNLNEMEHTIDLGLSATGAGVSSQSQPTRAIGTIYQNTTGKTVFVTASIELALASSIEVLSDSSATPSTVIAEAGLALTVASLAGTITVSVTFIVLNENYYEITASGTATLEKWTEYS